MAALNIDFSRDDNVRRSINSAKRAMEYRISDYNSIINRVNGAGDSGNLSTANSYIRKKKRKLEDKCNRLEKFKGEIDHFNSTASDADKRVANRINKETNHFYKVEGIKTGLLYTIGTLINKGIEWIKGTAEKIWNTIRDAAKNLWKTIREFYEKNKYLINLIVDALLLVAAVVALVTSGGTFAFILAAWGVATATADLIYDGAAYKAHKEGNDELAEELSEKGMKDVLEEKLGTVGTVIYYGMEITSAVVDIVDFGKNAKKAFEKMGTKMSVADRVAKYSNPDAIKGIKKRAVKQCIKEIAFDAVGISEWDDTGKIKLTKSKKNPVSLINIENVPTGVIKNVTYGIKTVNTFVSSDDSVGSKIGKSISITNKFDDVFSGVTELGYNVLNLPMVG